MAKYFEVSVKYTKIQDNGLKKNVTERYLVDSLSLTEAEAKVTKELRAYICEDFFATLARTTNIAEVVGDKECGRFYLSKVAILTLNDKTGASKRNIMQILVGAEDFKAAYENIHKAMSGTISDWELVSLAESAVIGVF